MLTANQNSKALNSVKKQIDKLTSKNSAYFRLEDQRQEEVERVSEVDDNDCES